MLDIKNIILKEIMMLLRNKRVLIGIFAPIFLLPILFFGYDTVSQNIENRNQNLEIGVFIEGMVPEIIDDFISSSEGIQVVGDKKNAEIILSFYQEDLIIKYDFARNRSMENAEKVVAILEEYEDMVKAELLASRGLLEEDFIGYRLILDDYATAEEIGNRELSNLLPLIIIVYSLSIIINFAVELTTKEKEKETLETIFSVPIRKNHLILGKLFSCILFGSISTILSLGIIYLIMPLLIDMEKFGFSISPSLFFLVSITIIPLIFIASGISIGMGLFASNYKESGAYFTPLIFIFMIPAYIGSTPGLEQNAFLSLIPILNSTLTMKMAFVNQLNLVNFGITFIINLLVAMISLSFMFKVFSSERIIFSEEIDFSFRLKRGEIEKKKFIKLEDTLISLSIIIILFINISLILPRFLDHNTIFYISQYLVFFLLPIGILLYLKADIKESLGLKKPNINYSISGFFLWIAAFSLAMIYSIWISKYVSEIPTMVELEKQLMTWSIPLQFFFIAFTPGLCEEVLFRGFAISPLEEKWGSKRAVVFTAIVFAIVHLDFVRLVPTFLLGLVFGYTRVKSKSLYPPIILHILNNAVAIFLGEFIIFDIRILLISTLVSSSIAYAIYRIEKKKE